MNHITINLRFPKDEYEELRTVVFSENRSIASIIRDAIKEYRKKDPRHYLKELNCIGRL